MKQTVLYLLLTLSVLGTVNAKLPDSIYVYNDSTYHIKKRPWRAALETFGLNVAVWGFDRFVMNEEFAHISINTIKDNIKIP